MVPIGHATARSGGPSKGASRRRIAIGNPRYRHASWTTASHLPAFRGGFVHHAVHSDAAVVQGVHPPPDHAENGRVTFHATFAPRQRRTYDLIWSVDEDTQRARQGYERLHARIDTLFAEVHRSWQDELVAMFTPNNGRYSGHLPELSIDNPAVQKIYGLGALGLAYFRRDSPYSQVGRTYDTLMPRYWPSAMVLWDYSLSGLAHALLDPQVMRQTLERWMRTDVHTHFGTCYLTGEPIGPWYAVNDYAMASMIHQYVSWQGDDAWLGSTIQRGKTVMGLRARVCHQLASVPPN